MALPRPIVAVVCVLGDKAWQPMLGRLASAVDALVLTDAPTAPADTSTAGPGAVSMAGSGAEPGRKT